MAARINAADIARIGASLSFADGDVDPQEVACLLLALEDLGVAADAAQAAVDAAIDELDGGADPDELLARSCAEVPAKVRPVVFEACAHIVMGDGVLAGSEVQRLAAVKLLLGIDDGMALQIVAAAAVSAVESLGGLEISAA
jgi:hypothetical protein